MRSKLEEASVDYGLREVLDLSPSMVKKLAFQAGARWLADELMKGEQSICCGHGDFRPGIAITIDDLKDLLK